MGKLRTTLRRLLWTLYWRGALRFFALTGRGFVVSGERWRACWMGRPRPDPAKFRDLVNDTYRKVADVLRDDFGVVAPATERLVILCGTEREMSGLLETAWKHYKIGPHVGSGVFVPGELVLASGEPGSPTFQAILAHELCHAFMHCAQSGRSVPLWIREGAPVFVEFRTAWARSPIEYAGEHISASTDSPLPVPLSAMLTADELDYESPEYSFVVH